MSKGSAIRKTTWLQSRKIETQVNQNWLSEKKKNAPPCAGHSFYLMNTDDFKNMTKWAINLFFKIKKQKQDKTHHHQQNYVNYEF